MASNRPKGKTKNHFKKKEPTAKFGVCRPNEIVLELSATRRLYEAVQPARRVDLSDRLVVDGFGQGARERLEETLQGERDGGGSGHRVVFLEEPPLGRSGLPIPKLDKVQDALGDRVGGARSFRHFEGGVSHVDGADAEQMHRELDLQRAPIL